MSNFDHAKDERNVFCHCEYMHSYCMHFGCLEPILEVAASAMLYNTLITLTGS